MKYSKSAHSIPNFSVGRLLRCSRRKVIKHVARHGMKANARTEPSWAEYSYAISYSFSSSRSRVRWLEVPLTRLPAAKVFARVCEMYPIRKRLGHCPPRFDFQACSSRVRVNSWLAFSRSSPGSISPSWLSTVSALFFRSKDAFRREQSDISTLLYFCNLSVRLSDRLWSVATRFDIPLAFLLDNPSVVYVNSWWSVQVRALNTTSSFARSRQFELLLPNFAIFSCTRSFALKLKQEITETNDTTCFPLSRTYRTRNHYQQSTCIVKKKKNKIKLKNSFRGKKHDRRWSKSEDRCS